MEGTGRVEPFPPIPKQKDVAEREFHRIMQGAALMQQMMSRHLMAAGISTDPVKQAEAMNRAIELAERQLVAFRRARDVLEVAAPGFTLPPAPTTGVAPARVGQGKPIPRRF